MNKVPKRVSARLADGLKRFQPVLEGAKNRDVNEHDTVIIVADILGEMFGYDKYTEVTREFAIRGTYCDLALKIDEKLAFLLEVKAIGMALKESHVKQAVDYAANQGVEWVGLTNGIHWQVYRVSFGKPIGKELVLDLDMLALNHRAGSDIDSLFLVTRESATKSALQEYHDQRQAINRFLIAAVILDEPVMQVIRRELRRISPSVKVELDEIEATVRQEVLKRDVVDGPEADIARKKASKASSRKLRDVPESTAPEPAGKAP